MANDYVDDGKRHRSWVFTHNNYTEQDVEFWKTFPCRYICFGKETAPTTGTPHLQGFFSTENTRTHKAVRKDIPKIWFRPAYAEASAAIYAMKDGDVYERGTRPVIDQKKAQKERWDNIKALAELGKFQEIESSIYITQFPKLIQVYDFARAKRKIEEIDTLDNWWIVGKTGSGKSRYVRDTWGESLFNKPFTKWWTGYNDEDTVLLDDFDQLDKLMIRDLKVWSDHYPFGVLAHCRQFTIRPKRIVITSNWTPEEIWHHEEDRDAILRRFKIKVI